MIYLFLEEGFEETEAIGTLDYVIRAGIDIKTVSGGKTECGTHGIKIVSDLTYDEISKENLDGVILPGGLPGTTNLENNPVVMEYVKYCYENKLMIAAICAAPSIPGHLGYLSGKKAVCYPSFEPELKGAEISQDKAVASDNIITGMAMGAVFEFGYKIVEYLKGKDAAQNVYESIYA